jgi:hypothetical protein
MMDEEFDVQEGDLVYDKTQQIVARVMEAGPTVYSLRKLTGGIEWDTHRSSLRKPTVSEELSAKAALANAETRIGAA